MSTPSLSAQSIPAMWNGQVMPLSEVRVSVLDRGWLFGDAVYEVVRVYHGQCWTLDEHIDRLGASLAHLRIPHDHRQTRQRVLDLVRANPAESANVYIQVSRGEALRSHVPATGMQSNELIFVQPVDGAALRKKWQTGISVHVAEDIRWGRCDIKTVNLLGNVLAAMAARDGGADEAILVDRDGYLTEGTHTTFFAVTGGTLVTPPLYQGLLPGITRTVVLGLARTAGIPLAERRIGRAEIPSFSEAFLTGTTSEVLPVVSIDGRKIGSGKPGPVTQRLLQAYQKLLPGPKAR